VSATRLRVDPIAWDGHNLCAELLPELMTLDDWGYPVLLGTDVPPHLRRAASACPMVALLLERARRPG
jgi:ferredoxin